MERKAAADAAAREAAFQALCDDVLGGLQLGAGVLSEVQGVLDHADAARRTRRAALHRQWHGQVFDVLQARLQPAVSRTSLAQLERALQAASREYVHATNTKRLFRDVVIQDDYNPLAPLARSIRIPCADLADPLLHDLAKAQAERALLPAAAGAGGGRRSAASSGSGGRCGRLGQGRQHLGSGGCYGLAKAVTWPMLETTLWGAGQIHATPYGHCISDATAEYVVRPAAPQALAQKASRVCFDDFSCG